MDTETRITGFKDMRPTRDEERSHIRQQIETVLERDPSALIIFAEYGEGKVLTGAVGSPITLKELVIRGTDQLADMLKRQRISGENG